MQLSTRVGKSLLGFSWGKCLQDLKHEVQVRLRQLQHGASPTRRQPKYIRNDQNMALAKQSLSEWLETVHEPVLHNVPPNVLLEDHEAPLSAKQKSTKPMQRLSILKVFLRSAQDKALVMRHKSNLRFGKDWMMRASVQPSLPLEERKRRSILAEVARGRNGSEPDRDNRFLAWLNLRTEKFELREVKQGKWVNFDDVEQPTEEELEAAAEEIDHKRNERTKQLGQSYASKTEQSKNQ